MIKIDNFNRNEEFKHYNNLSNPFIDITIELDITKIVNYCSIHKNLNTTIGYIISKAVNKIDNFKYRFINNQIYFYEKISTSYTYLDNDKVFYLDCEYKENYDEYLKEYNKNKDYIKQKHMSYSTQRDDIIWYSSLPWFKFNSLKPPYDKNNTIPQFIWDKVEKKGNKYYINLLIHVHHGFVDGYHIKLLLDEIKKAQEELK